MRNLTSVLILPILCQLLSGQEPGLDVIDEPTQQQSGQGNDQKDQILYSCILISRQQLSFYGDQLIQIVKFQPNFEEQSKVWKKMYAGHVRQCIERLSFEESLAVLHELQNHRFELKNYINVFAGFDMDIFKTENWSKDVIPEEEQIWKTIEDFESSYAEKKNADKKQADQDIEDHEYLKQPRYNTQQDQNPRVFGYSVKSDSKTQDLLILISVFGGIGFLMFLGYLQLSKDTDVKNKKKKSKKSN